MVDGFETRAIHDGQAPDPGSGAVVTPITLSSTFVQQEVGKHAGYEYARSAKPGPLATTVKDAIDVWSSHGKLQVKVTPADLISYSYIGN